MRTVFISFPLENKKMKMEIRMNMKYGRVRWDQAFALREKKRKREQKGKEKRRATEKENWVGWIN